MNTLCPTTGTDMYSPMIDCPHCGTVLMIVYEGIARWLYCGVCGHRIEYPYAEDDMPRKSKSDYPANWAQIADAVKDAAGWRCVRCGHLHDPAAGYTLTVHHLDLDPANCEWWNLPALCQRCHLHIQSKVVMERFYMFAHSEWFKPYAAGYYAHLRGLPTDRGYVMAHLEELLTGEMP